MLRNGVGHIVTDSPLLMQCMYAQKYGAVGAQEITSMALKIESIYPSVNVFLKRVNGKYQTEGRYQTESQAIEMDNYITNFLDQHKIGYVSLPNNFQLVAEYCADALEVGTKNG